MIFRVYVDNVFNTQAVFFRRSVLRSTLLSTLQAEALCGWKSITLATEIRRIMLSFNARFEGGSIGLGVAENSANGVVVCSVNRIDTDWGDNATYTLVNGAGDVCDQ